MTKTEMLYTAIYVGGGLALGILIRLTVMRFLMHLAKKTKWKTDDLIIRNLSKWVIFWFFLMGCLLAIPQLNLTEKETDIVQKVISSLYIFSIAWFLARVVAGLLDIRTSKDDSVIPSTSIIGIILKVIIFSVGLMIILQSLGVSITPILTALGVGGIAMALALQPTLSNLFSGLQILASGNFNIGDLIQLENGLRGYITDITWRNTTIRTPQNNIIIVPNSKMADTIVENFYLSDRQLTYFVTVGVGYESDLEKVERVSIEVAKTVLQQAEGGMKDFEPFVRFMNFGDSSIELRVFLRIREFPYQLPVTSAFIKALHKRFKEEGINIPFPIRTVYMKNN
jgi:small-conductance mechanosensitive channel